MESLRELSSVSSYSPSGGDIARLFQVMMREDLSREDATNLFRGDKGEWYFQVVLKDLKENLIEGIFTNSFKDYSKFNREQFKIIKNTAACKIIIRSGKNTAGMKLAAETIKAAEKHGIINEALELAREMENILANIDSNPNKYNQYKEKVNFLNQLYQDEVLAQSTFSELAFSLNRKRAADHLTPTLVKLHKIAKANREYKFRLFYYSCFHLWYTIQGDFHACIETCKDAIKFFEGLDVPLPYTTKWHFYFQLIPSLLSQKDFSQAEKITRDCLELPSKGSYNWHLTLLYKAVHGFHSDQPIIAYEAWLLANQTQKKFESDRVSERWKIVRAYLSWYYKLGRLQNIKRFQINKFLSEVQAASEDKAGQNVGIIVVHLLHLLTDKDYKGYIEKAGSLDNYIRENLGGKENIRSRCMLRMLGQLGHANFERERAEELTAKWRYHLKKNPPKVSVNYLETEMVPFEKMWEIVLGQLK